MFPPSRLQDSSCSSLDWTKNIAGRGSSSSSRPWRCAPRRAWWWPETAICATFYEKTAAESGRFGTSRVLGHGHRGGQGPTDPDVGRVDRLSDDEQRCVSDGSLGSVGKPNSGRHRRYRALRTLVRHGVDGTLVPPARPQALADALRGLMDDPSLACRLGEQGRERVTDMTWEHQANRFEQLVDSLALHRPAATQRARRRA